MSCDLIANLDTIRVTQVDACGAPVTGPHAFVSDCIASLAMNPNIDTQDDVIYRSANGSLCGVKRGCPSLLGYDLEFNFYQVSPQLTEILTGNAVVLNAATPTPVPVGNDDCGIDCSHGFALEFWVELIQPCPVSGNKQFLYGILPWVTNAYVSDLEIGSEQVTFQLLGTTKAGGQWDVGPWDVVPGIGGVPGPMLTPLGAACHRRMQLTDVPPPTPSCDYVTVPA